MNCVGEVTLADLIPETPAPQVAKDPARMPHVALLSANGHEGL